MSSKSQSYLVCLNVFASCFNIPSLNKSTDLETGECTAVQSVQYTWSAQRPVVVMVSRGRAPEQCTCQHTMSDMTPWCHIMTQLSDPHDSSDDWISYEQFADERFNKHSQMLEQLELGPGPGPPIFDFPAPPDFFPPPPPIPGSIEECETFSSHFDHCDISKVSSFISDGKYLSCVEGNVSVKSELLLWSCENHEPLCSSSAASPPTKTKQENLQKIVWKVFNV